MYLQNIPHIQFLTAANVVANLVLSGSVLRLIIMVFGRRDSLIYRHPIAAFFCRLTCTITLCGTVSNILTLSTPSWTEVLLNAGVSLNFLWISFYDRITNSTEPDVHSKVHKPNTSSGISRPPKSKMDTRPRWDGRKRPPSR